MPLRFIGGLTETQVTNILANTLPPELQADAILNQAAPVLNQWYTVLATTTNVRILNIQYAITTTAETLEIELTIDGRTFTTTHNPLADTIYRFCFADSVLIPMDFGFGLVAALTDWTVRPFLLDCRSIRVRIRKTTANGAGNLQSGVHYEKWT